MGVKNKRALSLKVKVAAITGLITALGTLLVSLISIQSFSNALSETAKDNMQNVTLEVASTIKKAVDINFAYLDGIASGYDVNGDHAAVKADLVTLAKAYGLGDIGYVDLEGYTIAESGDKLDLSARAYVQSALKGEKAVSGVIVDPTNGSLIMMFAVPVMREGNIAGVMYARVDATFLSEITNAIKYGESGRVYLVDSDGTVIAHPDVDKVLNEENDIQTFAGVKGHEELVAAMTEVINGQTGALEYKDSGKSTFLAFSEVEGRGWRAIVYAPADEVLASKNSVQIKCMICLGAAVVIALLIAFFCCAYMFGPLREVEKALKEVSEGNLTSELNVRLHGKDETASLYESLVHMCSNMSSAVDKVRNNSTDLNNESEELRGVVGNQTESIRQIDQALDDISQGASSQAEEITNAMALTQQMGASIDIISQQVMDLDEKARDNSKISASAKESMDNLLRENSDTEDKILEIVDQSEKSVASSENVGDIVQVIKDIAAQTNLLSLNASIEAARAGESGRGFAVVADEIGKLAGLSAESATNIQSIIAELIVDIKNTANKANALKENALLQNKALNDTKEMFNSVIKNISDTYTSTSEITDGIRAVDSVKNNIIAMIENLSAISEENAAATAQTGAATSKLLSDSEKIDKSAGDMKERAQELEEAIAYFK